MKKRVAILGAGPTGLALAWNLIARTDLELEIKIIEKKPMVGGMASGFEYHDLNFDFGSHKLCSSLPKELINDIKNILGTDLLVRPSRSRIRLLDRFMDFPHSSKNSNITRVFRKHKNKTHTYADTLIAGLGKKLCKAFYFPYIEKLLGLHPGQIAAGTRQENPCLFAEGKNFFYPKHGFTQLFEEMMKGIWKRGGRFLLMQKFVRLTRSVDGRLTCILEDGSRIDFDMVFATIPINDLVNSIRQIYPENITEVIQKPLVVPEEVKAAAAKLCYRGMLLLYLVLDTGQFSTYDTCYFPEPDILFARISESKNFSAALVPNGKTGLCVEIPCNPHDTLWDMNDQSLLERVLADMKRADLPVEGLLIDSQVQRLENAYPCNDLDSAARLSQMHTYLETIPDLVVLGRQGLFSHNSIAASMAEGYKAAACLKTGFIWDREQWRL